MAERWAKTWQVMSGWEATAELRRREAAAQPPRAAAVIVGVTGATSDEEVCDRLRVLVCDLIVCLRL